MLPHCTTADAFLRAEAVRGGDGHRAGDPRAARDAEHRRRDLAGGDVDGSVMVAAADEALYAAKAAGRNQSQVSHGLPKSRLSTAEAR